MSGPPVKGSLRAHTALQTRLWDTKFIDTEFAFDGCLKFRETFGVSRRKSWELVYTFRNKKEKDQKAGGFCLIMQELPAESSYSRCLTGCSSQIPAFRGACNGCSEQQQYLCGIWCTTFWDVYSGHMTSLPARRWTNTKEWSLFTSYSFCFFEVLIALLDRNMFNFQLKYCRNYLCESSLLYVFHNQPNNSSHMILQWIHVCLFTVVCHN